MLLGFLRPSHCYFSDLYCDVQQPQVAQTGVAAGIATLNRLVEFDKFSICKKIFTPKPGMFAIECASILPRG
jgi:hypothetical protein